MTTPPSLLPTKVSKRPTLHRFCKAKSQHDKHSTTFPAPSTHRTRNLSSAVAAECLRYCAADSLVSCWWAAVRGGGQTKIVKNIKISVMKSSKAPKGSRFGEGIVFVVTLRLSFRNPPLPYENIVSPYANLVFPYAKLALRRGAGRGVLNRGWPCKGVGALNIYCTVVAPPFNDKTKEFGGAVNR